jgi:hypothetical protein
MTPAATWAAIVLACLLVLVIGRDAALVHNERVKLVATALNNLWRRSVHLRWYIPTVQSGAADKAALGFAVCGIFRSGAAYPPAAAARGGGNSDVE